MKNKIKDLETLLNESKLDQEMRNILEELNEESELSTNDAPKVVEEGEPEEKSLHANNSDIEDMNDEEKTEDVDVCNKDKEGAEVMTEELKVNDAPEVVKPEAEEPKPVEATNADIEKMNDEEKTEDVKEVVVEEVNSASGRAKPGEEKLDDVIGHKFVVGKDGNDYNDVKKVPVYGQERKPGEKTLINPGKDETKPTDYTGDNIGKQRTEWENKNKHNSNYDWQKIKGKSEEESKSTDKVLTKESEDPVLEDVVEPVTPEVETAEAKGYGDGEVVEHTHEVCPVCGKCKCKPGECECPEDERCKCEEVENPNEGVIDVNKELESVEQSLKEMFNLLTEEELSTNDAPKVVGGENPDEKTFSANNKDIKDMNDEKYADDVEEVLVENKYKNTKHEHESYKAIDGTIFHSQEEVDEYNEKLQEKLEREAREKAEKKCEKCGRLLGDNGKCHVCDPDYGFEEHDLDESFSDYQLMQILEANGYEPSMENVAILRENEYIILDEGKIKEGLKKVGKTLVKATIPVIMAGAGAVTSGKAMMSKMDTDPGLASAKTQHTVETKEHRDSVEAAKTAVTNAPENQYTNETPHGEVLDIQDRVAGEHQRIEDEAKEKQKEIDTKYSNVEGEVKDHYIDLANKSGVTGGAAGAGVGSAIVAAAEGAKAKKKKDDLLKALNKGKLKESLDLISQKINNDFELNENDCELLYFVLEAVNYSPKVVGGENPDEKTFSANNKDIKDMNDEKYADDVKEVLVESIDEYMYSELLEDVVYHNYPELYELVISSELNEWFNKGRGFGLTQKAHKAFNKKYNYDNIDPEASDYTDNKKGLHKKFYDKYRQNITQNTTNSGTQVASPVTRSETDDEVQQRIDSERAELNKAVDTYKKSKRNIFKDIRDKRRDRIDFDVDDTKIDPTNPNSKSRKDLKADLDGAVTKQGKKIAKKAYNAELKKYRASKTAERRKAALDAKRKLETKIDEIENNAPSKDRVTVDEPVLKEYFNLIEYISILDDKLINMLEDYETVSYSTLDEALSLGYEYFDTEEKVNTLAEQVAFTIANDNNDRLFEELVEATAKANRLYEAVLDKYFEVGQERAISILEELAANDAPEVVEEGEPEEKAFSATNADIKNFNDEEDSDDVEEVIVKESIMEFLKESEYEESEENVSLIESAMRGEIVLDEGIINNITKKSLIKKYATLKNLYDMEQDLEKKDRLYEKIAKLERKMLKHGLNPGYSVPLTEEELSTNDSPKVVEEGKPEEKAFSADNKDIEKMNSEKKSDDVEEVIVENKVRVAKTPSETSYR